MNDTHEKRRPIERAACEGFTLVEVLLVVAILGILAGVVVVKLGSRREPAMIKATRASIQAICTAVDMYEVDIGKYPGSINDLVSDPGHANWNGPYIRGGMPADAWGTPFNFTMKGRDYVVTSAGPDVSMGTGDDITSFVNE